MSTNDLDELYRDEGWGTITDQVFEGRVAPKDVESAAREVARWAFNEIDRLQKHTKELGAALSAADRKVDELTKVQERYAKAFPIHLGTKAALLHLRAELRRKDIDVASAKYNAASWQLKIARAEAALAETASARGDHDMPSTIEERPLRAWLDNLRLEGDE